MNVVETSPLFCPLVQKTVETSAETLSSTLSQSRSNDVDTASRGEAWQDLVDKKLIEWGRDPNQFDEDGVVPPTSETVRHAIQLAQALCKAGHPSPLRVVPDAHGGIVFERREKNLFETLRVHAGGRIEYSLFRDWNLVVHEWL